jgi:hypothetical protein
VDPYLTVSPKATFAGRQRSAYHRPKLAWAPEYYALANIVHNTWMARTTAGSKRFAKLLDLLALMAIAVLVLRTIFVDNHDFVPRWVARSGELVYELSLAFLGAWIFNLLVIVIPRRRDKWDIYTVTGARVAQIGASAQTIIASVSSHLNIDAPIEPDREFVRRCFAKIDPNGPSKVLHPMPPYGHAPWLDYFYSEVSRMTEHVRSLEPVMTYYGADVISLIGKVQHSTFKLVVTRVREFGNMNNKSCEVFAESFADYWELCESLKYAYSKEVRPFQEESARLSF